MIWRMSYITLKAEKEYNSTAINSEKQLQQRRARSVFDLSSGLT